MEQRLQHVEKTVEGLKESVNGLRHFMTWGISLLTAVTLGGFALLETQINALSNRMDAGFEKVAHQFDRITDEFKAQRLEAAAEARATRAELSAQTSAIANSITATKQQAPQVILVPQPQPQSPPPAP